MKKIIKEITPIKNENIPSKKRITAYVRVFTEFA